MQLLGRFWEDRIDVAAGASIVIELPAAARVSVGAIPGSGGTATAEFTVSSKALIEAGTATWLPLIDASATNAEANRVAPTRALRLSAATAGASFDVLQWSCD